MKSNFIDVIFTLGPPTPIKKKKNNFETFQTSVTTG